VAAPATWRLLNGIVQRTPDAGATWTPVPQLLSVTLSAIASVSPTVCWVVGDQGAVLRTIDGVTWTRMTAPTTLPLIAVQATDADHAIVITASKQRFVTNDGGRTWRGN
jgi:photosystem II stability/assembly factor-like uncharacterized protein